MGQPMPIFERFAPGTEWVLSVGVGDWAPGTHVRVEESPAEGEADTLWVKVSFPDETVTEVPLEALA